MVGSLTQRFVDRDTESTAVLSFRNLKLFLVFLMSWQGNQVSGSIIQIDLQSIFGAMTTPELFLTMLAFTVLVERSLTGDLTLKRTYFTAPTLLMLLGLFISWCRGVVMNQRYAIVYEAHEAFVLPIALVVVANAFRTAEDKWSLIRVLILSTIFKALDGLVVYLWSPDPHKEWGVVQMWRDGFLLGIGVVVVMLFLHFKPLKLARLRRNVLALFPLLAFTLLMSYRRTFIVGSLVSAILLIVTIGKGARMSQVKILGLLLLGLGTMVMLTDPTGILVRLSGIVEPSEEGSAYIRLLELPNVLQNIAHNPIWGTPVATQWKQYYRMPASAVYTTLGTHNTYLYYPLRAGILGTVGFVWLLLRLWKSAIVNTAIERDREQRFVNQFIIHLIIVYQVACFFGLMYGDAVSSLFAVILVMVQLQNEEVSGMRSYKYIDTWRTWRQSKLVGG